MEIPAREFYRYLLLCGHDASGITRSLDDHLVFLPPNTDQYFDEQREWALGLLGQGHHQVTQAIRKAGYYDMWAAHRRRRAGESCQVAYSLVNNQMFRNPIEALLLNGYTDDEVAGAINRSITHPHAVKLQDITAYRRYFFNPRILKARDIYYLTLKCGWLRYSLLGLEPTFLEFALRLRYSTGRTIQETAYIRGLQTWLVTLESLPIRTDREGIKSLSGFLSSVKTFDHSDHFKKPEDTLIVKLMTENASPLEVL